ncbi:MAG: GNAT family N-acetyltransferase [Ignavibacteriaceae bacterium]
MITIKQIQKEKDFLENFSKDDFINFLFKHLERFGDTKDAISESINYAFSSTEGKGGFLLMAYYNNELVGELVMNKTGMSGYIPDYILVYIAVDGKIRGKGIGRKIVEEAMKICNSDIALHVEYDNPAKRLYERLGFTSKYAEMRYKKPEK